jgi:hypothetical protein
MNREQGSQNRNQNCQIDRGIRIGKIGRNRLNQIKNSDFFEKKISNKKRKKEKKYLITK